MAINFEWPSVAHEFLALFARVEAALKAGGHLKQNKKVAEADWLAFARALGPSFYEQVRVSREAGTLMAEPPRQRMANGFQYEPEHPIAIEDVDDLFVRGVCRVRNNLAHGEKFPVSGIGWERDEVLTTQALQVLRQAIARAETIDGLLNSKI